MAAAKPSETTSEPEKPSGNVATQNAVAIGGGVIGSGVIVQFLWQFLNWSMYGPEEGPLPVMPGDVAMAFGALAAGAVAYFIGWLPSRGRRVRRRRT